MYFRKTKLKIGNNFIRFGILNENAKNYLGMNNNQFI